MSREVDRSGFDAAHLRSVAVAAGLGFVLTPVFALVALLTTRGPEVAPLVTVGAAAVLTGVVVLVLPWQRLPSWSFHVLPPIGCALATWGVAVAEPNATVIVWTYLFIGPLVGFAVDRRGQVVAHLLLLSACMLIPVVTGAGSPETQGAVLIGLPLMWALSAVVFVLRAAERRQARLLRGQVRSDPLTGVGNRRLLDERLEYEIRRHSRSGRSLALVTLDLDRFKAINDAHGHPAGDTVLRAAASAITAAVRESDTVARQGGDEFSVLAPEIAAEGVVALADSLHLALASVDAGGAPLTAAVGWALFPDDAADAGGLVAAADDHQLRAKRGDGAYRTRTVGPASEPTRTR